LTAGASAPEVLVREIIDALGRHFDLDEHQVTTAEESITFKLPRELAGAAA
jgi:4-hydroxy-3-methylbut-2-enyl diphosphate reductase